jgi:hypothetical protein
MKPMTKEELAELLNGRQYGDEITSEEEKISHDNGLVVIFGASDDIVEFRGVINDEIDAYEGCFFKFNKELEIKVGDKHEGHMRSVQAILDEGYDTGEGDEPCSWQFKTDIPHSTFRILDADELYCVGIVINVAELP